MQGSISMSTFALLSILFICSLEMQKVVHANLADKPFWFIFGDSLADSGNNNKMPTRAKANYYPYGVDFNGSYGRFTNGQTIMDVMTNSAGLDQPITSYNSIPSIPLAYTPTTPGVNYASGGAGIHPESGSNLLLGDMTVMSFDQQVLRHKVVISRLAAGPLSNQTKRLQFLGRSMYVIFIGSNDYVNNYFAPYGFFITRQAYNPDEYATLLIGLYSKQVKDLYDLGARKFAIFRLAEATGCTPAEILLNGRTFGSLCNNDISNAIKIFNVKLKAAVDGLILDKKDASFVLVDLNNVLLTPFQGFTVLTESCCKVTRSFGQCDRGIEPCKNRNSYVFFDNIHPTEAANLLLGKAAWEQARSLVSPVGS
ncbi:GDSL esterase/lipase-like protein [Drosera capensis]